MNKIFWALVAVDATLFLILFVGTLGQRSSNDGGKEMALFFSVLVPGFILALAVVIFHFSTTTFWRVTALAILAGPGFFLCSVHLRNAHIDYIIREKNSGRGYFSGHAMKQMGAAVVSRDLTALVKVAPQVDLNTIGEQNMTLLRLAVEQSFDVEIEESKRVLPSALPVIKTLLERGAKPDSALETATKIRNPLILRMLLEAGANPNLDVDGSPVAFSWLTIMSAENLSLLIEHGLNLNETNSIGTPLVLAAAQTENWPAALLLLKHGADPQRGDRQGLTLIAMIPDRINSYKMRGDAIPDGLLQLQDAVVASPRHDSQKKTL